MEYDLKRKLIVRLLTLVALLYQKESLAKVGFELEYQIQFPKMRYCKLKVQNCNNCYLNTKVQGPYCGNSSSNENKLIRYEFPVIGI